MLATFTMFSHSHPQCRPRWRQAVTATTLYALALLLNPPTANGQAPGSIAGTVRSPGEAGLPLAVARLTELSLSTSVAADGAFRFDGVPPGTYLLIVDIPTVGVTSQPVTVSADRETTVELEHDHSTHFDEIVVTGSGGLRNESELPNAISVLAGTDLQLRMGATLGETLAGEPGLSSTAFVPGAARPIIRGLSSARVRVLNGGMGTGDVSVESLDHAVTSDPLLAEQIEVLRGPATLRYGSGAIGGAVNVVDGRIPANREAKPLGGRIDLVGGSVAVERTGALRLNGGGGEWAWHLGAVSRQTDPYEIPGYARLGDEHVEYESGHTGVRYTNDLVETRVELFRREQRGGRGSFGFQHVSRDLAAVGAEAFIPPTRSNTWAAFTSQETERGSVRWQFGARIEQAEHISMNEPDWSDEGVSASAGMVWTADEAWTLGLSASRSVRLPSPGELFS